MLTIYKASAGSGKTYTLTKQYLVLLLGVKHTDDDGKVTYTLNPRRNKHRSILAITFTNKATAEMKERIVQQLSRLTGVGEESDYTKDLMRLFGCDLAELREHAKIALNDILFDYHNFNVSTIDTFFQQVLRSLALELDHPGDFSLEIDQSTVLSEGLHRMMSAFNATSSRKSPIERTIINYMKTTGKDGKNFNIFNRTGTVFSGIAGMAGDLFNEQYKVLASKIDPWIDDISLHAKFAADLEDLTVQNDKRILTIAADLMATMPEGIFEGINRYQKTNLNLLNDGFIFTPKQLATRTTLKVWADKDATVDKYFDAKFLDKNSVDDDWFTGFKNDLAEILRLHYVNRAYDAIAKGLPAYSFMSEVRRYINEYRLENGVVVLADTNSILKEVMDHEGDVPFVYEKMAMRLEHFLIDEFQDTSRMQWHNLRPLVLNSVSYGNDNLIIGDEKQAIYRFRNSDSSMLHHGIAQDKRFADDVDIKGTTPEQNTNWRSAPQIVNFNNALFATMATNLKTDGYENVTQSIAPKNAELPGRVELHAFAKDKKKTDASEAPAQQADELTEAEKYKAEQLQVLVDRILTQHANGYAWRDIAVLANKNDLCSQVVAALQDADIPVATDEALFIEASPTVRLIISGMRLVYEAIKEPKNKLSNESMSMVFSNKFEFYYTRCLASGLQPDEAFDKAMNAALSESESVNSLDDFVDEIIRLQPSTLVALSDTILRERLLKGSQDIDPQKITAADLPEGEKPYVAAFNDVIHDYVVINGNDLGGFLRFWDARHKKLTIAGDRNSDMVNVLTIHKSKGLQYACVHLPFVDYTLGIDGKHAPVMWVKPQDAPMLDWLPSFPPALRVTISSELKNELNPLAGCYNTCQKEQIADNLNKTYVAFTRPERELDVYYEVNGSEVGTAIKNAIDAIYPENNDGNLLLGGDTTPIVKDKEDKGPEALMTLDPEPAPFHAVAYNKDADGVTHLTAIAPGEIDISNMPIVDNDKNPEDDEPEPIDPADRGTMLHYVLSRIYSTRDVAKMVRKYSHRISPHDGDLLRNMFADPKYKPWVDRWFRPGQTALTEVSIMLEHHEQTMLRILDRLVFQDDGTAEIIDYKFTADKNDEDYHQQLIEYGHFVRAAHPGIQVHAWLWYVDLAQIEQVY